MAERTRGAGVHLFGVILGAIEMIIATFIISFATHFSNMVAEITRPTEYYTVPAYYSGLLDATSSIILFGGIFVLLHAVKCIVNHAFMAYIASKPEKEISARAKA